MLLHRDSAYDCAEMRELLRSSCRDSWHVTSHKKRRWCTSRLGGKNFTLVTCSNAGYYIHFVPQNEQGRHLIGARRHRTTKLVERARAKLLRNTIYKIFKFKEPDYPATQELSKIIICNKRDYEERECLVKYLFWGKLEISKITCLEEKHLESVSDPSACACECVKLILRRIPY